MIHIWFTWFIVIKSIYIRKDNDSKTHQIVAPQNVEATDGTSILGGLPGFQWVASSRVVAFVGDQQLVSDVYRWCVHIYIYCVCISVIYSTYIRSLFWSSFWILVIYLKLLSGAIYYLKLSSCNIGLFGVSGTSFQGQSGWKQDMKSRHQSLPLPSRLLPQSRNLTSWKKRPHVVVRFGPTRDQLFPGTLTSASH